MRQEDRFTRPGMKGGKTDAAQLGAKARQLAVNLRRWADLMKIEEAHWDLLSAADLIQALTDRNMLSVLGPEESRRVAELLWRK
jgi:hypothetical protein